MYDSTTCYNLCLHNTDIPQDRYLAEMGPEQAFGIRFADGTYCNIKLTHQLSALQAKMDKESRNPNLKKIN